MKTQKPYKTSTPAARQPVTARGTGQALRVVRKLLPDPTLGDCS